MIKDEIRSKKIAEDTWLLEYSDGGCTSYVLKGEKTSLMIDPGYGLLNGRAYAEKLIGEPVPVCADTHGHFDHAGGNEQFDLVYMSRGAEEQAKTVYPSLKFRSYDLSFPISYLEEGSIIDLGGRKLEIFLIPNHSPGDIALLDSKTKILFTGDCIGPFVPMIWQMDDPQPCMAHYKKLLEKVLARRADYDYICTGHGEELMPADYVAKCLENVDHILAGNPGEPYVVPADNRPQPEGSWKWCGPRPGDFKVFLPEYKRVSRYAGTGIEYDIRYLEEK